MSNKQTSKDDILESFVKAANEDDFSLDISLLVDGAIVTGTLISAKEYFKTLSKSFKGGNATSKQFSENLDEAGDAAGESDNDEINYIHLKDTSIFISENKPTPSSGKLIWRGKLSEVNSFFLGKIKSN